MTLRRYILVFSLCVVFFSTTLISQNLCPNANFETYDYCPTDISDFSVSQWINAFNSCDYYNACSNGNAGVPNNLIGVQASQFGDGYAGIVTNSTDLPGYREYFQAALNEPLIQGCYQITMYYSNADYASLSNGLGIHLSVGVPGNYNGLTPHLEVVDEIDNYTDWFELSGEYVTSGGETHIVIGNFRTDAESNYTMRDVAYGGYSYAYIDSVAVAYSGELGALNVDLGDDLTVCSDDFPITLESGYSEGAIVWSTGEQSSSIEISGPGVYSVEVFENCEQGEDEILVEIYEEPVLTIDPEFIICEGQDVSVDLDGSLGDYTWSTGDVGPNILLDEPGSYSVSLTYECGTIEETFEVSQIPFIEIPPIDDVILCVSELPIVIDLTALNSPYNTFEWSDGTNGSGLVVFSEGNYTIEVSNDCFSDMAEFEIDTEPELPGSIPLADNTACPGEDLVLFAPVIDANYEWQDGSTNPSYIASGPGFYQLTMTNACGTSTYDFEIFEPTIEQLDLGNDISICPGDSVLLSDDPQISYDWNTGDTGSSLWAVGEGSYIASFQGECELISDTIVVSENGSAPTLTLADSIVLCAGDSIFIESTSQPEGIQFEWNTGSDSSGISVALEGVYSVLASNSCGTQEDSIVVTIGEPRPTIDIIESDSICVGSEIVYEVFPEGASVVWSDASQLDSLIVSTEGTYWVELTNDCGSTRDSFYITELPLPLKPDLGLDLSLCEGDSIMIMSTVVNDENIWAEGSIGPSLMVYEPGVYILEGSNSCGALSDTIEVLDLGQGPNVDLGLDQQFCAGDSIVLNASGLYDEILWSSGAISSQITVQDVGIYIVTVTNQCGVAQDTIVIEQTDEVPQISLGPDNTLCSGDSLLLTPSILGGNIEWTTGEIEDEIWVEEGGWYGVTLSSSCGSSTDSIFIEEILELPTVDLGQDTSICFVDNWEFSLDLPIDFDGEVLWSNGTETEDVTYLFGGTIWVSLTNSCGIETDTIEVDYIPSIETWTLPGDTLLCDSEGLFLGPDVNHSDVSYLWNTDDTTQEIYVTEPGTYSLQISNECESTFDGLNVLFGESPTPFDFPETDTICGGENLVLTENQGANFDYTWQDGSEETSYEILASGTYSLSISNSCGLEFSNSIIVVLPNDEFEIEVEDEYIDCEGEEILVNIAQQIGSSIEWFDGSTDWSNTFVESGLYGLSIFNDCRDTIVELLVKFEDCDQSTDIYIPNTFTPNEDGVNDYFTIHHPEDREILSSKISIYNRWGEQMYYSEESTFQWYGDFKGRTVQSGVYVYIYEVEFVEAERTITRTEMGDITISR